nr:hypothetical protein [Tanacetum cinerariifolium]
MIAFTRKFIGVNFATKLDYDRSSNLSRFGDQVSSWKFVDHVTFHRRAINVKKLAFEILTKHYWKQPSLFFTLQGLEYLEITNCVFEPPLTFKGFNRLSQVYFIDVEISAKSLLQFLSNCPLLEVVGLIKSEKHFEGGNEFTLVYLFECLPSIVNTCLEDLQIRDDTIGSKGSEELSKMIEANSTLKRSTIFDSSSVIAAPLISAVLARNRSTEVHVWSGGSDNDDNSKIVEFTPQSSMLRIYRINVFGACRVACALGWNTTVKSLDLTGVHLKSRWAKDFPGLFKNKSLEILHLDDNRFNGVGVEHLLCPLTRFSSLQTQANVTLKLLIFGGKRTKIGRDGLIAILRMLSTNQTLTRLGIYEDQSLRPQDIIEIFESLKTNVSLKCLSLQGCKGVDGDFVLNSIMETLHVNPWIEEIDLSRRPLEISGKADVIHQKIGQDENTGHEVEVDLLKDMPMTAPKSCRVFICGQEFARKTTLCNSISQNFTSSKVAYIEQVKTLVNPIEQAIRTSGIKSSVNFQNIVNVVQNLRDKFQGYLDFYPTVFTVDARSSAYVNKLTHHLRKISKTILQSVPRVYELCNDLVTILSDWRSENNDKRVMKWEEFSNLCQVKVPSLRVQSRNDNILMKIEMRRKAVATCLHQIGEVIYFEELGFLILDFEWFFGEVVGQLVKLNVKKVSVNDGVSGGFVSRKELEKILRGNLQSQIPGMGPKVFENFNVTDLVNIMLKLELCYNQDPSDHGSLLLIPLLLEDSRTRTPRWQLIRSDLEFVGRHLECHDSSPIFLTPDFFPRL